jgi:hypothetical protein
MLLLVFALTLLGTSLSSQVLQPVELKDVEFASVLFSSSPSAQFDAISVVWYTPSGGSECSASTLSVEANGTQAILIDNSAGVRCFPEVSAKAAAAKGFSAVIWRTKYNHPGYSAQSSWASNSAPIPMFEVSSVSSVWSTYGKVTEVNLKPSTNKYSGISWFGPQVPLQLLLGGIELTSFAICTRALPAQWKQFQSERTISTGQAVILIEIFYSALVLIELIDWVGQRHILPTPLWLDFLFGSSLLTFFNTFILGKAMFRAEATIQGKEFGKMKNILLNVSFAMFMLAMTISIIFMGWNLYQTDATAAVLPVFFVIFQGIAGFLFMRSKARILKMLKGVQSSQELQSNQKVKDLQRMSQYLYLSAIFMFAYMVSLLLPGYAVIIGSTELMVYSCWLTSLFMSLSGLTQVLSLPERITGIQTHLWERTSEKKKGPSSLGSISSGKIQQVSTPV